VVHHVSTEQGSLREEQAGGLDQGVGGWGSVFKFSRSRRKQRDIRWCWEHFCVSSPIHHIMSVMFLGTYLKLEKIIFSSSAEPEGKQGHQMPLGALL
jgi:hypothetical protein